MLAIVEEMQSFGNDESPDQKTYWTESVARAQELALFIESAGSAALPQRTRPPSTPQQLKEFGLLLRDKRTAAGLGRLQLARKAKLSEATIKFTETGRHPASRATLFRLIAVAELGLSWADVPGQSPPCVPRTESATSADPENSALDLNCYITPTTEPVRMVMDLGRFLNGAGGHVEQTNAYLDHQSAAGYLAMCEQSPVTAAMRGSIPLGAIAKRIAKETYSAGLNVIALGSGDAHLEVRLVQHLAEQQTTPDVRLCLFDVSQPLLSAGFKYATDTLSENPGVIVWAMQGDFHHLPLYTQLHYSPASARRHRIYCMLGNTLANLDNEPRFFQHSLVNCVPGDMLVLDVQQAHGSVDNPDEIRSHDPALLAPFSKAHAQWLAGPIYRHCKDVVGVEFVMELDTRCPMPGSYALDDIAIVKATGRPDRRFSMLRVKRYDVEKLAQCLAQLGWDQLAALPCGNATDKPSIVMLFCKRRASPVEQAEPAEA